LRLSITADKIEIVRRNKNNVTVKDIVHLCVTRDHVYNIETMRREIRISRYEFQQNIEKLDRKSQY
jgi:hypothetical protein